MAKRRHKKTQREPFNFPREWTIASLAQTMEDLRRDCRELGIPESPPLPKD